MFGLELRYNENNPLRCFSTLKGGVAIHLYTSGTGLLTLVVSVKTTLGHASYELHTVAPGDELRIRYLRQADATSANIDQLLALSRDATHHDLEPGRKLGIDCSLKSGRVVRVSHPDGGGFSFIMANVPLDHARAFVMAGNDVEKWHWQLPDMDPDDQIVLAVVETEWCDPPPSQSA